MERLYTQKTSRTYATPNFEAVTFPLPALAALQALRELGNIKLALKVLIYDASGCVGILAAELTRVYI
jgi:NADPH:quinone reductase-like Zn-dependent oxidoreductase